jgi:hypothetical protein
MDLIEDIGPILGIVAFLGFAILALLIVLQAREVRRLREWAGRAPERAVEADDAAQAAFEASGETGEGEAPGRLGAARRRIADRFGPAYAELNRRSPVDPRWFLAVLLVGVVAAGVLTSGFGLVGDDGTAESGGQGGKGGQGQEEPKVTVAVLNATQITDPVPIEGVAGLADVVAKDVVKPTDFKVETKSDAPAGEEQTLIMFEPDFEDAAQEFATAIEPELGSAEVVPMTDEVRAVAKRASLALLIGQDDAEYGQESTDTAVP